jgi:hypothetical protein
MNILIYNLNIGRQIQRLLAGFEKNEFNVLWLYSLCKPLRNLQEEFTKFSIQQRLAAYTSSQTLLLEHRLNVYFDTVLQRIYIENHTLNNAVPLSTHFTVHIPNTIDAEAVRRYTAIYTLADKRFIVIS